MPTADQIELRTTTFTKGHGWLDSYGTNLRTNDVLLGRGRWTTGASVLAQVDCEAGAWQIQPGDRLLRTWRLDGTATADDATRLALSTPIRGSFHYADNAGEPALDNRVCKGDSYIHDTGSDDRYQLHYDSVAGAFKGLGVRADYRTAATATSGATQNQASDRVTMRASRWDTSGTPAAKYREWSMFASTSSSASDSYSLLNIQRRHEGGAQTTVATLDTNGWLYIAGAVPGLEFNSGGAGNAYIRATATDPDGSVFQFAHGNSTRWARFRFMAATGGASGTAAEAIGLRYGSEATGGTTLVKSPSAAWWASAWDGVSAAVALGAYAQLIPTSTTAGYLEHGFDFGSGISRLYNHGLLAVAGSSTGGLLLSRYDDIDPSNPMLDSPNLTLRGVSEGVSGGEDREFKLRCFIGSPATEGDVWAMVYNNGNEDVGGVLMDGSRMVSDTASSVLAFQLAEDVHPALSGATTKTTPGAVDRWIAIDANGTTVYVPAYTSKTA